MSKAGIRVCASQKEKTSLGPVISSYIARWVSVFTSSSGEQELAGRKHGHACKRTLGTSPLKKAPAPSFLAMLERIRKPLSGFSKLRFWIRVLMTSRGAETTREAEAPAMEATKFWNQLALL
jgi:hypothetical protein